MGTDYFVCGAREHQVADLRARIHTVDVLEGQSVPEANALICCASTRCQKTSLLRAPTDSFNCRLMLTEFCEWLLSTGMRLPDEKFVIVATRSDLILIMHAPLESANLLLVTKKSLLIALLSPYISH